MAPKNVKPNEPSEKKQGAIKLSSDSDDKKKSKEDKSDQASKILGAFFVVAGLVLIGILLIFYILSKLPYRTDPNMPIPTLEDLDEYTSDDSVDVEGEVVPGETVVLYQDGDLTDRKVEADDSGEFSFEDVVLEEEGEVEFQAASVRGFILKKRSEKSNTIKVTVDRSDPSEDVELGEYPEETKDESVTISGKAEENSTVTFKRDGEEYSGETDEDGNFEVKDIQLEEGENEFEVEVEDRAGNKVKAEKISITRKESAGDLNGPGATDQRATADGEKLPESAGELDKALEIIAQNNIMFALGLLALATFAASSAGVYLYNRKRN